MPSNFPGTSVDSFATVTDGVTTVLAAHQNDRAAAIVAAQTKIGVDADTLSATTLEGRAKFQETGGIKRGSTVASATSITLPAGAQVFPITGTTTIATITSPGYPRLVYLEFASALTLEDGTGNLSLPGGSDIAVDAGAVLALEWTGSTWMVASGSGGGAAVDPAANVGGLRTLGTGALQAAAGNDSRFTSHATRHVTVGQDPIATFTATTRGLVPPPGGSPSGVKALYDNGTWADPAVASGGMSNPLTTEGGLIIGDATGDPIELLPGTDLQVVGVDPSDHAVKYIDVPSKHVIYDETTPVADQPVLAFQGAGVTVTDDAMDGATLVTIPGGSGSVFSTSTDGLVPGPSGSEDDASHVLAGDGTWLDTSTLGGGGGGGLFDFYPTIVPPVLSSLTKLNENGGFPYTQVGDTVYLKTGQIDAFPNMRALVDTAANTHWHFRALVLLSGMPTGCLNVIVRNSTSGKLIGMRLGLSGSTAWSSGLHVWLSTTSFSSGTITGAAILNPITPLWVHALWDGTNMRWGVTADGPDEPVTFLGTDPTAASSAGWTSGQTPNQYGLGIEGVSSLYSQNVRILSWEELALP